VSGPRTVAVSLDGALGDTRPLWEAFLADAARRYAGIAPLDARSLPTDRRAAAAALDAWAQGGVGDWRRALERFAEDHAPVHLRPDPGANAALRRLRRAGARIVVVTDAPEPLARVALAQLGLARSVDDVVGEPPAGAPFAESAADLTGAVTAPGYDQG
jgi:phosphoglycolate phosphatase-like HAD superfamily hydrolase